jgi:hypothetical protein
MKNRKYLIFEDWNGVQVLAKVLCKYCDTVLSGLVPDDRLERTYKVANGTVVKERYLVMGHTPEYNVVRIRMQDGSQHDTGVCKKCADKLTDEMAQELHDADISTMEWESRQKMPEMLKVRIADHIADRRAR